LAIRNQTGPDRSWCSPSQRSQFAASGGVSRGPSRSATLRWWRGAPTLRQTPGGPRPRPGQGRTPGASTPDGRLDCPEFVKVFTSEALTVTETPGSAPGRFDETADVIVVGAGPGGSTTAAYLAAHGLDVLLLEKTAFPREKVCGDGLTPRAVRELITLGIPTPEDEGWIRNRGLRIIGGGMRLQLDWPSSSTFPPYGLVRTRQDFDDILATHAAKRGARLHQLMNVT